MQKTTRWIVCAATLCATATVATSAAADTTFDVKEWLTLRFGGDLRLRNELSMKRPNPDDAARYRPRVRARLSTGAEFFNDLDLGVRLVTGTPDDENSTHQTMTDGFSSWALSVDRAYLKWSPESLGGSYIVGGKFAHPFYARPVYSEIVWDGDVMPAGAAMGVHVPVGDFLKTWKVVGGAYFYQENSRAMFNGEDASDEDGILIVGQTSLDFELTDGLSLTLASGLYHLPDPTPAGSDVLLGRNQGNATVDLDGDDEPDEFVADFTVIDSLIGLKYRGSTVGLDLGGQFVVNAGADDNKTGMGVGLAVPIKLCGGESGIAPYFDYHLMNRDATITAWSQDDHQRATAYRGFIAGLKYNPRKFIRIHTNMIAEDAILEPGDANEPWAVRVRVDLDVKF